MADVVWLVNASAWQTLAKTSSRGEKGKIFATTGLPQIQRTMGLWEVVELPLVVRSRGKMLVVVPGRGVAPWGHRAGAGESM